jgi:hypothetical protein
MKSIFTALRVLIGAALLLVFCWLTITGVDAGLAGETPHEKMVAWGIAGGAALLALLVWKLLLYRGAAGFFGGLTEPPETPRKPGSARVTPLVVESRDSKPKKRKVVMREIDRFEY